MKEQASDAKKSADAALLNAKTLIASERPRFVISADPIRDEPHAFVIRAVNKGKTPAQLFSGAAGSGQQTVDQVFVPAKSDLGPFVPKPLKSLFVSEDGFDVGGRVVGQDLKTSVPTTMFHVYGKIEYWDTFSDRAKVEPYVTQWCFIYNSDTKEFYLTGGDYNRNT